MGGNTKAIDRETGEVVNFFGRPGFADKIDLKRVDRSLLKKSIIATLKNLDSLYRNEFGVPIWDPSQRNSILSSGEAFNGSSEHLFNDKITDEEFTKFKSSVGDIDLTIPAEKIETVFELLSSLEGKEIVPGKIWYVGQNRKKYAGDQINSLFAYRPDKTSEPVFIQIDFEAVDYSGGRPDSFAKFGHSSAWEDVKEGVKGVFHKYLLRSLTTKSTLHNAVILTKNSPLYPPEKVKVKKKSDPIKLLSFSVSQGLRPTVELQKYPDDPQVPKELVGQPVKLGDSFVYRELSTAESSYIKNIEEIFTLLFDRFPPTADDVNRLQSFSGILSLMKKYMSDADIENIYEDFVNEKLFSPEAQRLDLTSSESDKTAKLAAVGRFRKEFSFLSEPDESIVQSYYSSYKIREAVGRFIRALFGG
jgi:hypothetical protein